LFSLDYGHDIGFDYDNMSVPLRPYWGDGSFPFYKEYPSAPCDGR